MSPHVGSGLVEAGSGQSRVTAGPAAFEIPVHPVGPLRQLTAGAPLMPRVEDPVPEEARRRYEREGGRDEQQQVIGQECAFRQGDRDEQADPRPAAAFAIVRAGVLGDPAVAGLVSATSAGMSAVSAASSA